jgi:di/tricarboxylate transporter
MKNLNLNTILMVVIAVMATWMIRGFLTKSPPNEKAIRLELEGEYKERERIKDSAYYSEIIQSKDSVISVLLSKSTEKQVQYIQLKSDEKKIRPTVESYSNNELLRRANGWQSE